MVRPGQAFCIDPETRANRYKHWDLPKPELPVEMFPSEWTSAGFGNEFLFSIGVRSEPGVEQILRAAKVFGGKPWTLVEIVRTPHCFHSLGLVFRFYT